MCLLYPYLDVPAMPSSRRSFCLLISTGLLSSFSRYRLAIHILRISICLLYLISIGLASLRPPCLLATYFYVPVLSSALRLRLSASLFHPYLYITLISLSLYACFPLVRSGACSSLYLYLPAFFLSIYACFFLTSTCLFSLYLN
jgi:hypothetical protein